jgi:hypothetical protein
MLFRRVPVCAQLLVEVRPAFLGKKILASLNSTRRRMPGMLSASQCDHFTSK